MTLKEQSYRFQPYIAEKCFVNLSPSFLPSIRNSFHCLKRMTFRERGWVEKRELGRENVRLNKNEVDEIEKIGSSQITSSTL